MKCYIFSFPLLEKIFQNRCLVSGTSTEINTWGKPSFSEWGQPHKHKVFGKLLTSSSWIAIFFFYSSWDSQTHGFPYQARALICENRIGSDQKHRERYTMENTQKETFSAFAFSSILTKKGGCTALVLFSGTRTASWSWTFHAAPQRTFVSIFSIIVLSFHL